MFAGVRVWTLSFLVVISGLFFAPHSAHALKDGVYKPGTLILAGKRLRCGKVKTLVSLKYWKTAGSIPGLIGLNPRKLKKYSRVEQWFIYTHECGHIAGLRSELNADCYGVQQGLKLGWLDQKGLDQLCAYWRPKKGDAAHPPGKQRCERMSACFNKRG